MAYGYIHREYSIDFPMSRELCLLIKDLEEFDEKEDVRYYAAEEVLDLQCKEEYGIGRLTKTQWETLVRRYWSNG